MAPLHSAPPAAAALLDLPEPLSAAVFALLPLADLAVCCCVSHGFREQALVSCWKCLSRHRLLHRRGLQRCTFPSPLSSFCRVRWQTNIRLLQPRTCRCSPASSITCCWVQAPRLPARRRRRRHAAAGACSATCPQRCTTPGTTGPAGFHGSSSLSRSPPPCSLYCHALRHLHLELPPPPAPRAGAAPAADPADGQPRFPPADGFLLKLLFQSAPALRSVRLINLTNNPSLSQLVRQAVASVRRGYLHAVPLIGCWPAAWVPTGCSFCCRSTSTMAPSPSWRAAVGCLRSLQLVTGVPPGRPGAAAHSGNVACALLLRRHSCRAAAQPTPAGHRGRAGCTLGMALPPCYLEGVTGCGLRQVALHSSHLRHAGRGACTAVVLQLGKACACWVDPSTHLAPLARLLHLQAAEPAAVLACGRRRAGAHHSGRGAAAGSGCPDPDGCPDGVSPTSRCEPAGFPTANGVLRLLPSPPCPLVSRPQHCKQLTALLLHDCPRISERALMEVAERCPQLRELDCSVARRTGVLLMGEDAGQVGGPRRRAGALLQGSSRGRRAA